MGARPRPSRPGIEDRPSGTPTVRARVVDILAAAEAERRRAEAEGVRQHPLAPPATLHQGTPSGTSGVRARVDPADLRSVPPPPPPEEPFSPLAIPVCHPPDETSVPSLPPRPRRLRRLLAAIVFLTVMGGALFVLAAGLVTRGILVLPDGPVKALLTVEAR